MSTDQTPPTDTSPQTSPVVSLVQPPQRHTVKNDVQPAFSKAVAVKIAKVMADTGFVEKRGHNTEQKYKYATAEDIADMCRKAMAKVDLALVTTIALREDFVTTSKSGANGLAVKLTLSCALIDGDTGEAIMFEAYGDGIDYPGDKAYAKAVTGGMKFALRMLFLLPTGDDPETEIDRTGGDGGHGEGGNGGNEQGGQRTPQRSQQRSTGAGKSAAGGRAAAPADKKAAADTKAAGTASDKTPATGGTPRKEKIDAQGRIDPQWRMFTLKEQQGTFYSALRFACNKDEAQIKVAVQLLTGTPSIKDLTLPQCTAALERIDAKTGEQIGELLDRLIADQKGPTDATV